MPTVREVKVSEPVAAQSVPNKPRGHGENSGSKVYTGYDEESSSESYEQVAVQWPGERRNPDEIPKDYVPAAESIHELYHVRVPVFEGPLDLLLFLIRKHQIDIFHIPIAFICARYVAHLEVLQALQIDVAAEFMVTAAELMHIKSRLLLPPSETTDAEAEDEEDPRAELVRRLLDYQRYKEAAKTLEGMVWLGRDTFARPPADLPAKEGPEPLREVGVFALVEAFAAILKRQKPELRHNIIVEQISLRRHMRVLVDLLATTPTVLFETALGGVRTRLEIIVTFLSCLEMTKLRLLRVVESEAGQIYLRARFESPEVALACIDGLDEGSYAG